jgi:hypothetical protein
MTLEPRWLDREATARYLSLRVDELPRMLRAGKLPQPSYHFGPKSPRWDREELDTLLGGDTKSAHRRSIEEKIAEIAANFPGRRKRGAE